MQRYAATVLWVLVISGILVELTLRLGLGLFVGKEALLYGFLDAHNEQSVAAHGNVIANQFSKYFPGQIKTDTDHRGQPFEIVINNQGYRGNNFVVTADPGTFRIVTLGASSTFGYHAREDQTYPAILQDKLNNLCQDTVIEVINLGIPHLDIKQINSLYRADGASLKPDVVTYYEGINDSQGGAWRAPVEPSTIQKFKTMVRERLLSAALLKQLLRQESSFNATQVQAALRSTAERYVQGLEALQLAVQNSDAQLVVATQLAKSDLFPEPDDIKGIHYDQELQLIEERLAEDGEILNSERILAIHANLMQQTREWAEANNVPLVDAIDQFGDRRDVLVSWVHLSPAGNEMIAEALTQAIAPLACPGGTAPSGSTIAFEHGRHQFEQDLEVQPE